MGLFTFLLIVQTLVAVAMIAIILMQRSEGGGLVSSGGPSGMMSARGATDFLTRSTAILATIFVGLSIALAGIAAGQRAPRAMTEAPAPAGTPATAPPAGSPAERQNTPFDVVPGAQQQPAQNQSGVPLAQ